MTTQVISEILNEIVAKVVESHHPIYGKEWGAYPSDSELDFEETDYGAHESLAINIYDIYGIRPVEWRDEDGKLTELVFHSTKNTPKWWGVSMTLSYESEDEEEYDQGDVDDYWRERAYYDC